MGNQVCKFVIFLYVYIPVIYACFCEHVSRAPLTLGENPGDATDLNSSTETAVFCLFFICLFEPVSECIPKLYSMHAYCY